MLSQSPSMRRMAVAVGIAALLSACVSAEPPVADVAPVVIPAVTTQPEIPPEPVTDAVQTAIEEYWEARDSSFAAGPDAGIAFLVGNNHPQLPYTAEECREAWFDGDVPIGFAERTALLAGSVESDPGWTMVQGPLAGRDLGAGLFTMVVAFSYEGDGLRVADRVANVHLQVVGGTVRQFLLCEQVEVIVAAPPADTTTAPAAGSTGTTAPTGTPGTVAPQPTGPIAPSSPTLLPPITATPTPVNPPGGGGGTAQPTPEPTPQTGTRPPGSGIDFCTEGDPGAQPVAGDYFLCPDSDVSNERGEDGGSSEPDPVPAPTG